MPTPKVALITGAGRGIGRGIALALAERGWRIALNYRCDQAAAEQAATLVSQAGGEAHPIRADIGEQAGREHLLEETLKTYQRIDLLVNNAGMAPRQRTDMLQVSEDSYDEVLRINLKGPFFLTQNVANTMIALIQQGVLNTPQIVNISSVSAFASSPQRAEYCLSKAGISMMTALWADRLAEYGIRVYEIQPGIITTDMTGGVKDKYDQLIDEKGILPLRRWGQPADVGKAVAAIAEELLPYSTGEVIRVDGGFHLHRL